MSLRRARTAGRLPTDLAVVAGLVLLADLVLLLDLALPGVALRVQFGFPVLGLLLGLPLLVFLPGYAVISALYPAAPQRGEPTPSAGSLPTVDRLVLAVVTSLVVVAALGVLVMLGPWQLTLLPVLIAVSAVTLLATLFAVRRRQALPPDRRFVIGRPTRAGPGRVGGAASALRGRSGALLLASIVLFAAVAVSPVIAPPGGESFSEASLVAEDEAGQLTAGALPTTFERGQAQPIAVALENHEGASRTYTVVVQLQRVDAGGESAPTVLEQRELDRFSVSLGDGEGTVVERDVVPTMTGDELRLQYLVFVGDSPPADPSSGDADLTLELWIAVE